MSLQTSANVPRAHLRTTPHPLDIFLGPGSVAVLGGSEEPGSVGRTVLYNLILNPFGGMVFPICTHHSSLLGVSCYPSLNATPAPVELAIIAAPAPAVPEALEQCQAAGVKAAIVLSTDFRDPGVWAGGLGGRFAHRPQDAPDAVEPTGPEVERLARECLRRGSMRVLGLNSFGVVCPRTGFNASLAPAMAPAGRVGFLSQSGAVLPALLNEEYSEGVGCSVAISVGSLLDISWAEWLNYLAGDPRTECIGIYMEHLDDARSFFAAAREVAAAKPIILVKGGWSGRADPARDEVFHEACRSNGVLLVQRLTDLFRIAAYLPALPVAKGRRLAILTNARGPAVLAKDALDADGGQLAPLTPHTVAALEQVLPHRPDPAGPIDVGPVVDTPRLADAAAITARDPNVDALLLILAPQFPFDQTRAAQGLHSVAAVTDKPLLTCWMWGAASPASLAVLRDANIPTFHSPEAAVRAFGYLRRHGENTRFLSEIREALGALEESADPGRAAAVYQSVRGAGRDILTETEAEKLLRSYGLPGQARHEVNDAASAVEAAERLGYPVVLEIADDHAGEMLRLKVTDAAGVHKAARALQRLAREHFGTDLPAPLTILPFVPPSALEVTVRGAVDERMGPIIQLGRPGPQQLRGRNAPEPPAAVSRLAPLSPQAVREMTQKAGVAELPERDLLEKCLLRMSRLVAEQPWIEVVSVGSLVVWGQKGLTRGVRVSLRGPARK